MFTRLVCLIFAVAIACAGVSEESLILLMLASGIVAISTFGIRGVSGRSGLGDQEPVGGGRSPWLLVARETWVPPSLPRRALVAGGVALAACVLATAFSPLTTFGLFSALSWVVGIGAVVVTGPILDGVSAGEIRAWIRSALRQEHRPEIGTVLAMMVVAFGLRVYQLDTVPMMFHVDEGVVGLQALKILQGQYPSLLRVDAEWPQPYVYTYMNAISMWLFGPTVFGLRFVGVVFGTLGVPVVYAIGRVGWGPAAGAIAGWLFVVSHLQNHYSRLGTFVIESVPTMALVMLLLALAYERGRPRVAGVARIAGGATETDAMPASGAALAASQVAPTGPMAAEPTAVAAPSTAPSTAPVVASPGVIPATLQRRGVWTLMLLAGLACGFAQYFYYGSRLIPVVVAPLLLLLWYRRCVTVWQAFAFAFGFFVIVAPLAEHFMEYPNQFSGRLSEVSIWQDSYVKELLGPSASMPSALPALLREHTLRSLYLFAGAGDLGGFYSGNTPNFDVVTIALIWLGLGATLARAWRFHEASLLLWFAIGLTLSSVLTWGAHNMQRVLIITPAAFLFGSVFVARTLDLVRELRVRDVTWLAAPVGTTLALWLLAANVSIYFYQYVPRAEMSEPAAIARDMVSTPGPWRYYFLTSPIFGTNDPALRFIARGIPTTNLRNAADFQPPPNDGQGITIFALESYQNELRALEARLPGGTENRVNAPNGRVLYIVYRVPPGS